MKSKKLVRWLPIGIAIVFLFLVLLTRALKHPEESLVAHDPPQKVDSSEVGGRETEASGADADQPRGDISHSDEEEARNQVSGEEPSEPFSASSAELEKWRQNVVKHIQAFLPGTAQSNKFREELLQLFKNDPTSLNEALRIVEEDATMPYFGRNLIITAFARVDDPELAHSMLLRLANSHTLSEGSKLNVVSQMSLRENPPAETITTLLRLSQGSQDTLSLVAKRALGKVVGRLVAEGNSQGKQILNSWQEDLRRSRESHDVTLTTRTLMTLGLTQLPEVLPVLKEALQEKDPVIRGAAIDAIGRHDGEDRYQFALLVMQTDDSPNVVRRAIHALYPRPGLPPKWQKEGYREIPQEVVSGLAIAVQRQDTREGIRGEILSYIERCYDRDHPPPEDFRRALQFVADHDSSKGLRGRAARLLRKRFR